MRLRRRKAAAHQPKANRAKVAILEHELLNVQHESGSYEATVVEAARPLDPTDCPHDEVTDITSFDSPRPLGLCRCGVRLVEADDGAWVKP